MLLRASSFWRARLLHGGRGATNVPPSAVFPLFTKTFPGSADELTERLNDSLQRIFLVPAQPVSVTAPDYPTIAELTVSLDGAQLRGDPPRPVMASGTAGPPMRVEQFAVSGRDVVIAGASVDVSINAEGVRLNANAASDGNLVLNVAGAAAGQVQVSASLRAVETLIAQVAKHEAAIHGVTIDSVQLQLQARGPRSVTAEVRLRARKLFLSASIRIAGELAIDEKLTARLSALRCEGDGAIASVACGVLTPHLQRLNGREFSLMALPLGDIRLRDVRLAVGDQIAVTAEFGA